MTTAKRQTKIQTGNESRPALTRAAATRNDILVAAAHLFAEKGYDGCNLRQLAEKVGMKAGSFYYHFKSKEEILDELVAASVDLVSKAVEAAIAKAGHDAPARDRISAAIRAHVTAFLGNSDHSAFIRVWEHLPRDMKLRNHERRKAYATIWHDLLSEGLRDGCMRLKIDVDILVPFVLTSMSRSIEWYKPRRMKIEDVCEILIQTLLADPASDGTPARTVLRQKRPKSGGE